MPVCEFSSSPLHELVIRQSVTTQADDDYSCSASKPCSNGACCSKKTGYCNYGPDACGPGEQNDGHKSHIEDITGF